jgi:hypothetical protein
MPHVACAVVVYFSLLNVLFCDTHTAHIRSAVTSKQSKRLNTQHIMYSDFLTRSTYVHIYVHRTRTLQPHRYVYENMNTLERQDFMPTKPAALSTMQLKTAIAANEMERELAYRRLNEVRAMQHLALTTSGAQGGGPESDERRAMDLLIQQQQFQLESEQRETARCVRHTH